MTTPLSFIAHASSDDVSSSEVICSALAVQLASETL